MWGGWRLWQSAQASIEAPKEYSYSTGVFDTTCQLQITGKRDACEEAAQAVIRLCNELHRTLNRFDEKSELARFNRHPANQPFPCSEMFWEALLVAQKAYTDTDGAFDITIGPLMNYWREVAKDAGRLPSDAELAQVTAAVGFERLQLEPEQRTVTKTAEGMSLDFGGFAKGFALDLVRPLVDRPEISDVVVDFGGNLYLRQDAAKPVAGMLRIRNPHHGAAAPLALVEGCNGRFIATSANSERPLASGERAIGHIVDPKTGQSIQTMSSVTAITTSGAASDIFSTAVFIGGVKLAEEIAARNPETGFVLLEAGGEVPFAVGDVRIVKNK